MPLFFYYSLTKKSKQTEDLDYICNGYIYKDDSTAENLSYSPISLENSLEKDNTIYFKKPDSWSDSIYESDDSSYSDVQTQIEKPKTAISSLVEKSSENTDSSNADNSTEETKEQEENSLTSNPYTGDIILIITGILILASIILAVTTIYLKKNKNK